MRTGEKTTEDFKRRHGRHKQIKRREKYFELCEQQEFLLVMLKILVKFQFE
jgi:hypothetical protein